MSTKNIMLFVYDFPHKKTQDFLFRLIVEGYNIKYVIAAPWQKLNIQKSLIRNDHQHIGLVHPQAICKKFKINYLVADHNSQKATNYITKNPVDLYIISGARILSHEVIKSCGRKVLNIHPGLLPDVRGLDTFLWSIYYKKPLGITAHFITPKIDSGLLIYKERLPIKKDDTPFDVTLRLLEYQTDVLVKSIKILKNKDMGDLNNLANYKNAYNTKMNHNLEKKTLKQFKDWLAQFTYE